MSLSLSNNEDIYDYVIKIVIIGDSSVGKTNILSRYHKDEFNIETRPTLGVAFATKLIINNNKKIRMQIWDTAGQEKYKSITNSYYINAKGAIVVYDLCKRETFLNLDKWVNDVRSLAGNDVSIIIAGNKCDKLTEREVSYDEGFKKSIKLKTQYIETSALENFNISNTFEDVVNAVYNNYIIHLEDDINDYDSENGDKSKSIIIDKINTNNKTVDNNCSC